MRIYSIIAALVLLFTVSFGQPKKQTVVDRFLRYVKIDTQSKEDVDTIPSTRKQFDLARVLVAELKELGLKDARVDDHCYVYATLPSNLPAEAAKKVPAIGLISHMDTSPAVSGKDVNPIIHSNYQGGDIVLPKDKTQIITVDKNPHLAQCVGSDIITADGTTLLGSDDKSGCAEIMTLIQTLVLDPTIKHGTIAVGFTPDEEVGNGAQKFDIQGFGARYAYTVDGEFTGSINTETWNADEAVVTVRGKSTHPGTAKGIMVNSLYALSDFILRIPPDMRPETTEKRIGFLHPFTGSLETEESRVKVLLRDFDLSGLERQRTILAEMRDATLKKFPDVKIDLEFKEKYRNMKLELDKHPFVTEYAFEAARRAGVQPELIPVRGGTDGAVLTYKGLPCPNLFTGGQNFHGKLEWVSVKGMESTVTMLLKLVQVWTEKSM